jgi:ABC-type lipoprotein release transport system permease subunit
MRTSTLLSRNLTWYWRTNLAVLLGVAMAAGALGGAALVGESVRASLRELALGRLGNADYAIVRNGFFREELAGSFPRSAPIAAMDGVATREESGQRAYAVQVYGVDERFWKFQGEPGSPPGGFDVLLTAALAKELGARPGDPILLRVEKPSAIPLETLHGRKEDAGKTMRLTIRGVSAPGFSLRPQQGEVRAAFVPLGRMQRELDLRGVNTILVAGGPGAERVLKSQYALSDLGIGLRQPEKAGPARMLLESDSALIGDALAEVAMSTARGMNLRPEPALAYLANTIRRGTREIPYSVVAAVDNPALAPARDDGITLNEWAARDLGAKAGDSVTLEYFVWKPDGGLRTESASFRVERSVRLAGEAADREFTPNYPGVTATRSMRDWDPPFPLDMKRIRPVDEKYWRQYGATPKAFIRLGVGRRLWGTRFGSLTSIRITPPSPAYAEALRAAIDPSKMGLAAIPVKAQGMEAARGATDFGEYFVYFSFFLVISALLLTGLFFKLGIEQRAREIGVLRALGFSAAKIRSLFLLEGAALAIAGGSIGVGAALAYGGLVLLGLRTWWFDAVGTRLLTLHASVPPLAAGAAAGVIAGLISVAWTLRGLQPVTPRGLLAGHREPARGRRRWAAGAAAAALAAALAGGASAGKIDPVAGFFGAGAMSLSAALLLQWAWLHARGFAVVRGRFSLGLRSVAYRPGRSILCIALIASAAFVIASLDAFRRGVSVEGTGGFPLLANSELPVIHDPNTASGRAALGLPPLEGVRFVPFRVRPGDDASCLNLYQPRNPRILAPPADFLRAARFSFQGSASGTRNPWLLLESQQPGGAIPAIADANSMTYALHRKLGEEFDLNGARFRIVAALQDSLFQSELLISEANFLRLYPDAEGYRFFLLSVPPGKAVEVTRTLEESLSGYGFDVQPAEARLAEFHRVENAYLSTFRALGGLGLVLGVVGLAAVLMRNVLERRKELALLRAVGYRPRHIAAMVLAENAFLLVMGLATGALCAALAVAPAVAARGGHFPAVSLAILLAFVLAAGASASLIATAAALRSPLLAALKSE